MYSDVCERKSVPQVLPRTSCYRTQHSYKNIHTIKSRREGGKLSGKTKEFTVPSRCQHLPPLYPVNSSSPFQCLDRLEIMTPPWHFVQEK